MKNFRQAAALCVSIVLAAASVPAFTAQAEPDSDTAPADASASVVSSLPASYDLRKAGLVTKVGDEMQYNASWAFAAANSMESSLLASDPQINLSEWNMAYYMFSDSFGYKYDSDVPFNGQLQDNTQLGGFLTSWIGPVREEYSYHFGDMTIMNSDVSIAGARGEASFHVTDAVSYLYQPANAEGEIQNEILAPQIAALKERIYGGHALSMRVLYADPCYNENTSAYCFHYESIADTLEEENTDWRYLSIVGWDDEFPAASFKNPPAINGAWLCKDSRGTAFGDNGYIWVSYADSSIDSITELRVESAELNNCLYQYDDYGCSGSYLVNKEKGDTEVMIANVFTAETNGWITGIMFYNQYKGDAFEATIYTDLTSKDNPVSGTAAPSKSVVLDETGYLTIELDEPVFLKKGELFSVTAKVSGSEPATRIPCEFSNRVINTDANGIQQTFDSSFTMEMLESGFETGQSFYSTDGSVWVDMYNVDPEKWSSAVDVPLEYVPDATEAATTPAVSEEISSLNAGTTTEEEMRYGNICLKAVTRNSGTVVFSNYTSSIKKDEGIRLSNDDNAPIYYSLDGTTWELYDDENPIKMPEGEEMMILTAYADLSVVSLGDEKRLYTQIYFPDTADVSSLLCKSDKDETARYADMEVTNTGSGYVFYAAKDAASLEMTPISTGTITIGGTEYKSGETIQIPLEEGENQVKITVSEEGKESSEQVLRVARLADSGVKEPDPGTEPDPDAERILGDVNGDSIVNSKDGTMILVAAARIGGGNATGGLTEAQQKAADVNKDTKINSIDATSVFRFAAAYANNSSVKLEDYA